MLNNLFLIGISGSVGAITRFLVTSLVANKNVPTPLPYGTILVNWLGSFLFGYAFVKFNHHALYYLMLTAGFFGSLTTFSTFIFELLIIFKNKKYAKFVKYLFLQVGIGLLLTISGILIGLSSR